MGVTSQRYPHPNLPPQGGKETELANLSLCAFNGARVQLKVKELSLMASQLYLLLYDGHCAFCEREVRRLLKIAGERVSALSFHTPGILERYPSLTYEACMQALKLIHPDGSISSGAAAVVHTLALNPRWSWLPTLYHLPGLRLLCELGYQCIARNRYRFRHRTCPEGTCQLHK